ncbi:MAG: response regulator [Thermomicrobiales bacterium]
MPGIRLLVVEDDTTIRDLLTEVMLVEGFEIQCAANGLDALTILTSWVPDIIILDLMMPVMDAEAFRQYQLAMPAVANVPILVLSALNDLHDRAEAIGADAVVAKPFDLDTLVNAVRRLVTTGARTGEV